MLQNSLSKEKQTAGEMLTWQPSTKLHYFLNVLHSNSQLRKNQILWERALASKGHSFSYLHVGSHLPSYKTDLSISSLQLLAEAKEHFLPWLRRGRIIQKK